MLWYTSKRLVQSIIKTTVKSSSTNSRPDLRHFLRNTPRSQETSSRSQAGITKQTELLCSCDNPNELRKCSKSEKCQYKVDQVPVYVRTYGCQMNESDTKVVTSILQDYGYRIVTDASQAEIQLLMTCAIRESAENKIWAKLRELKRRKGDPIDPLRQVGLLGCMAERLKEKVLETDNSVDIVAGPDAYRDLPRLFAINSMTNEKAINCLLSFDETYSDIRPVTSINEVTSFISITRGCDNLCSYCIVPFTRGRERSRPLPTILDEIMNLMDKGIKEVTLLGQNVNSYRDIDTSPSIIGRPDLNELIKTKETPADGFTTVYKPRQRGITFDILLEEVAKISPELRIRFTSPHPKDFTDDVIDVMARYPNIARCIHLPAQSGSNSVLQKMRRGYTRESYLDLVDRLKTAIPKLAITSDFITGFCGETADDHDQTIDLIKRVKYNFVYVFPYSERTKTTAYHRYDDDVPHETKIERVKEIYALFRDQAAQLNHELIGTTQLVLIESDSLRSTNDWQGRTNQNIKTIVPKRNILDIETNQIRPARPGDYVACRVLDTNAQTLKAEPLIITTQARDGSYLDRQYPGLKQINR
uniref:CDK5 regulatory subunit-associated protein 1 n=1 Tax=Aceria tosichella TaxID=561515 RepID=A0A6G1SIC2_9ACAR